MTKGQTLFVSLATLSVGLLAGVVGARSWHQTPLHTEESEQLDVHDHDHSDPPTAKSEAANRQLEVCEQTAATIGLTLHEVDFGPLEQIVELLGTAEAVPDLRHVVSPRTAGQVLHAHAQIGDSVKKGDVLVEIDSAELAHNIFQARKMEADYQELLVELTLAKGEVRKLEVESETAKQAAQLAQKRLARLESAGSAVALNELNNGKTALLEAQARAQQKQVELEVSRERSAALADQAEALRLGRDALYAVSNVDPAQADLAKQADEQCPQAPWRLGLIRLRSPIDGVVVRRDVSAGEGVEAGQTLMVVADHSRMQIHGELPESLLNTLSVIDSPAARIRPLSVPDSIIEGQVRFISPVIDPVKRTAHLIVDTPNANGLLHEGSFVNLAVIVRDMLDQNDWPVVVPVSAILQDGPISYVFKQVGIDGLLFERCEIVTGARNDRMAEVVEGLYPGDKVVMQGAYSLSRMRSESAGDAHAGHNHAH